MDGKETIKKYEFTGETKQIGVFKDITIRRIRATAEFGKVKLGDLGGWIEKEENLSMKNDAWVYGNAEVYGDAKVYGNAKVCGAAEIYKINHFLAVGPIGSRDDFTTFYRDKNKEITVKCGCFLGKIDEFLEKVQQTHGSSRHAAAYRAAAELAKTQIDVGRDKGKKGE